ncbi:type I restriction endonuclease subunit R [Streptococcus suis]|uniref:type I site-specific deoxyribonuclease n=1 Tax=Streptococcus suis TaxID=1307 RepID=A0A4T2H7G6_STRSU|nr:DEAD/DEAH box helicase family protein [Streptococcus suis]TII07700.1 type I restriction endonuclease subunit R [Streptococcus suis]
MSKEHNELTRVQLPAALHLIRHGYSYLSSTSEAIVNRDQSTNILVSIFKDQFLKFNNYASEADFEREFENICLELEQDDLGRSFFNRIQADSDYIYINWENIEANTFHIALEVTCQNGEDEFRPDITVFINGLPLSYIEVKQPDAIRDGKTGIQSEKERTKFRFENKKFRRFNNITQLIAFSDNLPYDDSLGQQLQGSYYCTNASSGTKFNSFKEEEDLQLSNLNPLDEATIDFVLIDAKRFSIKSQVEFQTNLDPTSPCNSFLTSLYQKERFFFMLRYGLVYVEERDDHDQIQLQKHAMRYPQYFATKAIERSLEAGMKKGVIWHTQGSGKTALAFFNIRYLRDYYAQKGIVPQFYFVVDRLDLADQAFKEFSKRGLKVKRINKPSELNQIQDQHQVSVVNIQKFKETSDLTDHSGYDLNRQNIYFIDEAHRSYNEKGSYLPNLYNADKEAVKVALTGTPLIATKADGKTKETARTTRDIFGDYIHKYYYNQSIADGFTLRLMREDIETSYKENLRAVHEDIQKGSIDKKEIFAHPRYVSPMLDFIVEDFTRARNILFDDQSIGGMIVCDSSEQAREVHKQLEERRLAGQTSFTSTLILHDAGDKEYKKEEVDKFKKGQTDFVIVYSMLLTGFDAPRLKRLYLGRKIKAHNLLQTLTRVNRPYKDYVFGYVIDFADISKEFDKTNKAYLEELNREYQSALTEEDGDNPFGAIFVSPEEVKDQLASSQKVLMNYPTENWEDFHKTIYAITDRKELIALRKSLESMRQYYNMARLHGYQDLIEQVDIKEIARLLNMLSNRLINLSLIDRPDSFSSKQLLNLAMSETSFNFVKIKEEELRLAANDLDDIRRRVATGLQGSRDEKDPEWISLYEEFQRVLNKHMKQLEQGQSLADMMKIKSEFQSVFDDFHRYKADMNRLTMTFGGDAMTARAFKRTTQSTKVSEYPAIYQVLKGAKPLIDYQIGLNHGILENEAFLVKEIRRLAREEMKKTEVGKQLKRVDYDKLIHSLLEVYEGEY